MNISMICFSMTGLETGEKLQKALQREGDIVTLAKRAGIFRILWLLPPHSGQENSSIPEWMA